MPPLAAALVPLIVAYLVGALPFGYLVGRFRGVNLFQAGSGNIGATNAGRVLGRKYGAIVFVLDLLKGAAPVAVVVRLADALAPGASDAIGGPGVLRVGAAALAFLGHLFPVYLGFRGGKGVATGAGTVFVLVPLAATLAITTWVVVLFASRFVSLASLAAGAVLVLAHLVASRAPFTEPVFPVTLYLIAGTAMVFVKHRANAKRLLAGSENAIGDFPMRQPVLRGLHVLVLGLWFGGAAFFNFGAATAIFDSFKEVVNAGPSDRTAYRTIIPADAEQKDKDALASALAGSAVGPVFPRYFAMQAVCAAIALLTALSWFRLGGVHRVRVFVIAFATATVIAGWPISNEVARLRLERFNPDATIAAAAKTAFVSWHFVSLGLSIVTVGAAGVALALAGRLPGDQQGRGV
ncbi:glycerol-3-phosphate 1-O-acyltransferase PlsY [Gemmata sp. JC717]|uniref:glycerol-3-phosphate 1-O-acyltransferase PlsY n=1 Tax=Gemmata algarum TaxID=2975278 RepID=UPI0021BB7C5F|nr:glycerol-3-phosphate 1-O-acyltransferase PlsY [Gemmata algarum]MDY3554210.1 glycerol-3-phosphate 1-O-acyltransferase PlsY [Gemmata algarum]